MFALVCLFVAAEAAAVARLSEDKNRPVTKVINVLKDMGETLKKEQEEDEEVYEKLYCWCETNDKEKTAAIADAESRITALTASIEEGTASSSKLNTEIKNLGSEIAKNTEALDKATALRREELAEFNTEEKDVLQSIGALKSAVTVLGKHNEAFLQVNEDMLLNIAVQVHAAMRKHHRMLAKSLSPSQHKVMTSFIQSPSDFFDTSPTFIQVKESYAPQSGAIFGILKQMKETFETNLASSQKEEMESQSAYEDLKSAKESEIKAGTELKDTKTQELADTDAKVAQEKQDMEDTRNCLAADQKFLMNLKETCQNTDAEWEERQKVRQEEMKAVSEALAILSSDDAHDTFTSTFNFIQLDKRSAAAAKTALYSAAKKFNNPRLAAMATRVRMDNFAGVSKDIDEMKEDLKKEKAADVKQKDFCNEALAKNELAAEMKRRDIEQLDGKIAELTEQISQLTKDIASLQKEIAEMQVQLKRAGEDRELENSDFQKVIADQRATQELLTAALDKLKGFYDKAFLQTKQHQPAGPPPPPSFKKYENSSGSGGVMGMIQQIIAEAEEMEKDAVKAETDAQKAYESFVKDTNKAIEEKTRDMTNKSEEKAEAEVDLSSTQEAHGVALNEAQELANENADLHKTCDFLLGNFDLRQAALENEMESLDNVKSVLQGAADAMSFMQKK